MPSNVMILCYGCDETKKHKAKGLCLNCYQRQRSHGSFERKVGGRKKGKSICSAIDCLELGMQPSGLCRLHYKRHWATGSVELLPQEPRQFSNPEMAEMINAGMWPELIIAMRDRCTIDENGCWIAWETESNGYGRASIGGKRLGLHRLIVRAVRSGEDLGHEQAHHICANKSCINPEHVEGVSQQANIAEMLERTFYKNRIKELESNTILLEEKIILLQKELEDIRESGIK